MEEQLVGLDGVALGGLIQNGGLTARELYAVTRHRDARDLVVAGRA